MALAGASCKSHLANGRLFGQGSEAGLGHRWRPGQPLLLTIYFPIPFGWSPMVCAAKIVLSTILHIQQHPVASGGWAVSQPQ